MLTSIIKFSLNNKLIIFLFTFFIVGFGLYSLTQIKIGAVPDITNNQVQVITTSKNLSTQDIEKFITYPIEIEMANLPGVTEIRSVSKFGLSVVTIVFEDRMGTYLPRQLISEKIKSASEKIPAGFGVPEMGPITTGLGEIYQYILDTDPQSQKKYSPRELRTIQDWIVKRQLSGIPGVVEVNTWGGYLKQYEVAINPEKLKAMNVSTIDVYNALERNNSIAGGGYIEKLNKAYFIRGEGLIKSIEDIENIKVKTVNGFPIYIKNVAKIGFGSATRFGAITGNGEGEKVLGQVMMLKGGNSKKVIEEVKDRVENISKTLPEGVIINGFLERSELIAKTTNTVTENLILGCLIVIFIVVILLGNLRSGLVIASVIPITLLFALSLMNLFNVDANLMSLGAIDFGIIIDGSVIIVEYIAFQITSNRREIFNLTPIEKQRAIDEITLKSASKMMNSAVFGQLIIIIVFIPILSLNGVEGKMFKPMAMTFSFAIVGAMILGLTYVPVVSSIFLKPAKTSAKNISNRIMNFLYRIYEPSISWALGKRKTVLFLASLLLGTTIYIFSTMGGEFVPTLDEGDFVIQPTLKTGTSLSKTIEITTRIENILLENFPEVDQVVSRIGAAEIPTDPMSMEESDVIIKLKPKEEWVSAESKDELADKFKDALSIIPGMEVEFTQPIEMRFNELITGVRADIAIKLFGEDLEILMKKGDEIRQKINDVEGASDITLEKIAGLPQMIVIYNRNKIARYDLDIEEVNKMISMHFSGAVVGSVFEGEKRFDLVIRLEKNNRNNISILENLLIDTPAGTKIPLHELATISVTKGPAKISRDDTKRRIVIGINVRNRDLQSVVDDVKEIINNEVKLPVGYSVEYGGQFENFKRAKSRLKMAVPISLILIFLLLYFVFNSTTEALMIYSAIPLSAVGGVLLLWFRDLPFSISAGVGFIALFGIAVLNGIVLIEHFKELKMDGITDIDKRIKRGTKERLRPVILTAAAAALGFLPMAISTSAGAEVQRPLATVVIGGLVSSTILTMLVLPILYSIFDKKREIRIQRRAKIKIIGIFLLFLSFSTNSNAQTSEHLNLNQLYNLALENNAALKASEFKVEESNTEVGNAFTFDKTELYYSYDENNVAINGEPLKVFGIQQDFLFPTLYFADKKLKVASYQMESSSHDIRRKKLEKEISSSYYRLQYEMEKEYVYKELDSFFKSFSNAANRRFELGETNYLEKITSRAKEKQLNMLYKQSQQDVLTAMINLQKLVQSGTFTIERSKMDKVGLNVSPIESNPGMQYYESKISLSQARNSYEKQKLLPDISLNYFLGSNTDLDYNLSGYQIGLKIPILFSGNASKIKASKISKQIVEQEAIDYEQKLNAKLEGLMTQLKKHEEAISYYELEGKSLSEEIFKTAKFSFSNGEIDFFQYILSLENALEILLSYLNDLHLYNQKIIEINYLNL